jgi:hypothetical protein
MLPSGVSRRPDRLSLKGPSAASRAGIRNQIPIKIEKRRTIPKNIFGVRSFPISTCRTVAIRWLFDRIGSWGSWSKPLIQLVGAAGFEPTTCSTQNCRATRLRYTPISWEAMSIHAYSGASKAPDASGSMSVEERVPNAIARRDSIFLRRAGGHLQHALRKPPGVNDFG